MSRKRSKKPIQSSKTTQQKPANSKNPGEKYRRVLIFLLFFITQIILFYILYSNSIIEQSFFSPLANFYAKISGSVLSAIGYANTVTGDVIASSSMLLVSVKKGCDAAEPMAIFLAAVIAFPASIRSKLPGIAFGLTTLFVLNIIRVVTLFIAGIHFPNLFETMHLAVWQVIFIIIAMLLWFLWLQYSAQKTTP